MEKKILVIDDDPLARKMIVVALEGEGYEAVAALNFEDALQKAREKLPDLVIIDVVLPGITGFEGCIKIKKLFQPRPPRVTVMTGKITMTDLMRARTAGVDDFVATTLDMSGLMQNVRKVFSA